MNTQSRAFGASTQQTGPAFASLDEAVEAARALRELLAGRVAEAESLRKLPPENVRELLESGLIRLEAPRRFGGSELNLDALIEVTATLAEACSATGWVYALWGAHMWLIAHYPEDIQEMVFGDPNTLISSVVSTEGKPLKVEGGYRWTGRGFFSSGVDHCTWLTAALDVSTGEGELDLRWFLIPRSEFEIVDDWYTMGLKGTGSKTITVDNVFVPDERIVAFRDLSDDSRASRLYKSPVYQAAFDFTYTLPLAGPIIGITRALLAACKTRIAGKLAAGRAIQVNTQNASLTRLAEAAAQMEAGRALLIEAARRYCNIAAGDATPLDKAQGRRDVAYGAQLCRRAANTLFELAGASNIYDSSDIQRLWKDSNAAAAHATLQWDGPALTYGRALLGLPPDGAPATTAPGA
jgi:alkylation response protein AidB-like acyl-CoA dehydrogenase